MIELCKVVNLIRWFYSTFLVQNDQKSNSKNPLKSLQPTLSKSIVRGSNIICIIKTDKVYCKMILGQASKIMECKDIDTFRRHMKGLIGVERVE